MEGLDDIVRRLAAVTDELIALGDDDFAHRFALITERDELRAKAKVFHESKDARRTIFELQAELDERRRQLEELRKLKINMTAQALNASGHTMAISREHGGTLNNAMMKSQGAEKVFSRIAELEQELTKRGYEV